MAFTKIGQVLEKEASWGLVGNALAAGLSKIPGVGYAKNVYNGLRGQTFGDVSKAAWGGLKNTATLGDIRGGYKAIRDVWGKTGPEAQAAMNAGLAQLAKGVGKSGLLYGGGIYGASQLF